MPKPLVELPWSKARTWHGCLVLLLLSLSSACTDSTDSGVDGGPSCEMSVVDSDVTVSFEASGGLFSKKTSYSGPASLQGAANLVLPGPAGPSDRSVTLEITRPGRKLALGSGIEPWVTLESAGGVGFEGPPSTRFVIVRDGYPGRVVLAAYQGSTDLLDAFAQRLKLPIVLADACTFRREQGCNGTVTTTLLRARFDSSEPFTLQSGQSVETEIDAERFDVGMTASRTSWPSGCMGNWSGTSVSIALVAHDLDATPDDGDDRDAAGDEDAGDERSGDEVDAG